MPDLSFSHRTAASLALTIAIAGAVVVETVVVHLLLYPRIPSLAIGLLLLSLASLVWLVSDHRAYARQATRLSPTHLHLHVARRAVADIPRDAIASAMRPSWKDIPPDTDSLYLNASAPAEPNVLLRLHEAAPVRLFGSFQKRFARIGVCFDDPDAFLTALAAPEQAPAD